MGVTDDAACRHALSYRGRSADEPGLVGDLAAGAGPLATSKSPRGGHADEQREQVARVLTNTFRASWTR
jgi:hypothetical protein